MLARLDGQREGPRNVAMGHPAASELRVSLERTGLAAPDAYTAGRRSRAPSAFYGDSGCG